MMSIALSVLVVLLCCVCWSSAHFHAYPNAAKDLITGVELDGGRERRQASREPIRIVPLYHNSVDTALDPSTALMIKNETLPKAIEFFQNSLRVNRVQNPVLFGRNCTGGFREYIPTELGFGCSSNCATTTMCGQIPIPEDHFRDCIECNNSNNCENLNNRGAGVSDADVVLYISAIDTNCPPPNADGTRIIAFASACQFEATLDRPIAGNVNFCPLGVSSVSSDLVLDFAKHEIAHILAFAAYLLFYWRDENGIPRTPRDSVTFDQQRGFFLPSQDTVRFDQTYDDWITISGTTTHNVTHLVTPAALREARAHFDCPSLSGVELENQGGPFTAVNHWEKRIFGNEAMTGVLIFNPVFSRISLAAFEDSGWYDVNYDKAEDLVWGKGAGCDFATGSCLEWINSRSGQGLPTTPFCTDMTQQGCTVDREAVGVCKLATFPNDLPSEFQYFTEPTQGGGFAVPDYCPFLLPFQVTEPLSGRVRGTDCRVAGNLPDNNTFAENYGSGSRCLEHGSRAWSNSRDGPSDTTTAGCYQYSCSSSTGVTIMISNIAYQCSCEGQEIRLTFTEDGVTFNGSFICPACSQICYDDLSRCPSPEPATCYGMVTSVQVVSPTTQPPATTTQGGGDPTIQPPATTTQGVSPTTQPPATTTQGGGGSGGAVGTTAVPVMVIAGLMLALHTFVIDL